MKINNYIHLIEQLDQQSISNILRYKVLCNIELLETIICDKLNTDQEQLDEAAPRLIIRVNSRGQRTKKKVCPKGFSLVGGTKCVPQNASQKLHKKLAIRKALKTKRADSSGRKRAIRKQRKAMTKRKQQGL
jgi:hypothetical protein